MSSLATSETVIPVLEPHPELYREDGDVVLQAPMSSKYNPPKFQLFCIQKALLSSHSIVFHNLFADASANLGLTYEGRPLINMPDDAADLAHLLLYLYDPSLYLLRASHPDTPPELIGAVKLADKYVMSTIRSAMVKRVALDWPTTLDQWDVHQHELRNLNRRIFQIGPGHPQYFVVARHTPEPVAAINFARAHGCPELLPAAFYRLASIEVANDWDSELSQMFNRSTAVLFARWSLCDREDLLRYAHGRQALAYYHATVYARLRAGEPLAYECDAQWTIDGPPDGCYLHNPPEVPSPCYYFLYILSELRWGRVPTYDPLQGLLDLLDYGGLETLKEACPTGLCAHCEEDFSSWVDKERRELWGRLPVFFKLT